MRKLLNTLYVTTEGAYLSRDGETVLVRIEEETRLRLPIHTIEGIVCVGRVAVSPPLMELCAARGVTISFLGYTGRFLARVVGPVSGNVLLRRTQYRWADDGAKSAEVARAVVCAKIANSRVCLMRAARERDGADEGAKALGAAADTLRRILGEVEGATALDFLRGKEGEAARAYFGAFDHFIVAQRDTFYFERRTRRPPLDAMNALISFLYALLMHDVRSALEIVGLDPAVGYLHRDRPGRPGLSLDLMEPFRAPLADRLALTLVNRQQVRAKGFRESESGAITMDDDTRKAVIVAYQERKRESVLHPFIGETVPIGVLFYLQALLLARHLRGELDAYPAYFWK